VIKPWAYVGVPRTAGVEPERLVTGLTVVFAGMTGTVVLVGIAGFEPVAFVVAVPLAAATVVFWYHSSGRLRERVARTRAGATAGTGDRSGAGEGFGAGAGRETRRDRNRRQGKGAGRAAERAESDVSRAAAYRRLDLEPGAGEAAVRAAYRRKVKDVHPDRGGDEAEFRRVTEAYERLID
jgi:hypothetical protein